MKIPAFDPLLLPQQAPPLPKQDSHDASFAEILRSLLPQNRDLTISSDAFSRTPSREKILAHAAASEERRKLYEAARQFENFFLERMFREMRKNLGKNDILHGGPAEDIFQDMLLTERVNLLTQKATLGLAEQIYTQMQALATGPVKNGP
ncbi:MAG: rod-binding protein [Turneriella sp.]|nr:rod-binding protein [Turneriella sp.]